MLEYLLITFKQKTLQCMEQKLIEISISFDFKDWYHSTSTYNHDTVIA